MGAAYEIRAPECMRVSAAHWARSSYSYGEPPP
ncbi:hypothetical protein J2S55_008699 [Streptosporangium brasiliense]|uniref:Uncharacterized protein n=1 Tax=Streptosporangium brasiliense TaxID=47480 RepID=A0ABT9RJF2_9ACTN|nr:hypothetical protein [Streptosporangium brasiliense]